MKRIAILIVLLATCVSASTPLSWIQVKGGAWVPDESVLVDLRASMNSYVSSEAARRDAQLAAWVNYRFQYQGRIEGKKRVVFVNAFCHSFGDERLESEFLVVFDGGPCFFSLEYDPETHKFSSLRFNGYG